jgi:hypothetical protein
MTLGRLTILWLAAIALLIPAYLVLAWVTGGSALIGFGGAEHVWTTEYLIPGVVALALAAFAWKVHTRSRSEKVIRAVSIGLNLVFCALMVYTTVTLWGDHI